MSADFQVTIHGARGEEWHRIAGTNTFPVRSPIPVLADLPGRDNARVFLLDLELIEVEVKAKIVAHLSTKFGLRPEEAEEEIRRIGIPILEDECSVMVLNPQRWF